MPSQPSHSHTQTKCVISKTKKRLRRAECKVRDLTVEIQHMADLIEQYRMDVETLKESPLIMDRGYTEDSGALSVC